MWSKTYIIITNNDISLEYDNNSNDKIITLIIYETKLQLIIDDSRIFYKDKKII